MSATVGEILELVDSVAPFELAEPWDNTGLLAGRPDDRTEAVLCALDLRTGVIEEALERDCGLIVTHHPILFRGRKNLCETDGEGRLLCALIRSRLSMIAAHTNYDNACPGVNDALAGALGLADVRSLESGARIGGLRMRPLGSFADDVAAALGGAVRTYGPPERPVKTVAVLGGSGGDYVDIAIRSGADVYVTGEISHHKALEALDAGLCVIEAGHAATERPAVPLLVQRLKQAADERHVNVSFIASVADVF